MEGEKKNGHLAVKHIRENHFMWYIGSGYEKTYGIVRSK